MLDQLTPEAGFVKPCDRDFTTRDIASSSAIAFADVAAAEVIATLNGSPIRVVRLLTGARSGQRSGRNPRVLPGHHRECKTQTCLR